MGIAALYTGLIIWRLYVRMDSLRFPIRTYGDMAERLFGTWAKHTVTSLQTLQLIVNVGSPEWLSISMHLELISWMSVTGRNALSQ